MIAQPVSFADLRGPQLIQTIVQHVRTSGQTLLAAGCESVERAKRLYGLATQAGMQPTPANAPIDWKHESYRSITFLFIVMPPGFWIFEDTDGILVNDTAIAELPSNAWDEQDDDEDEYLC